MFLFFFFFFHFFFVAGGWVCYIHLFGALNSPAYTLWFRTKQQDTQTQLWSVSSLFPLSFPSWISKCALLQSFIHDASNRYALGGDWKRSEMTMSSVCRREWSCHTLSPLVLLNRWVFDSPGWSKCDQKEPDKFTQFRRLAVFRGEASRQTAYALGGPYSSPGSLCLKAQRQGQELGTVHEALDALVWRTLLVSLRMGQEHM